MKPIKGVKRSKDEGFNFDFSSSYEQKSIMEKVSLYTAGLGLFHGDQWESTFFTFRVWHRARGKVLESHHLLS